LNRGYFEVVLMKNTPRTLGVNIYSPMFDQYQIYDPKGASIAKISTKEAHNQWI
jgi:hypothetical protein